MRQLPREGTVTAGTQLRGGQHGQVTGQPVALRLGLDAGQIQGAGGRQSQALIADGRLFSALLGGQRHIGRQQGGEHQLGQQRPGRLIEALQVQRQLRHLETRKGGCPGAELLVEPVIQHRRRVHEEYQLQALAIRQPVRGRQTQGYLGRHPGEGRLRQQGVAPGLGYQQQFDGNVARHHLVQGAGLHGYLGGKVVESVHHRERPHP
ncbi:hypothetical protein D3C72_1467850 [compost metagenome]